MATRILHFADVHLDAPFKWAPREAARKRRQGLRDALSRIADLAISEHVDALTCGGDLYEQDYFTPDTAEFLRTTFERVAPIPVLIAPGNHDWLGPVSLYRRVRWGSHVRIFEDGRLTPIELRTKSFSSGLFGIACNVHSRCSPGLSRSRSEVPH